MRPQEPSQFRFSREARLENGDRSVWLGQRLQSRLLREERLDNGERSVTAQSSLKGEELGQ